MLNLYQYLPCILVPWNRSGPPFSIAAPHDSRPGFI